MDEIKVKKEFYEARNELWTSLAEMDIDNLRLVRDITIILLNADMQVRDKNESV